jgi:hypothetical protein
VWQHTSSADLVASLKGIEARKASCNFRQYTSAKLALVKRRKRFEPAVPPAFAARGKETASADRESHVAIGWQEIRAHSKPREMPRRFARCELAPTAAEKGRTDRFPAMRPPTWGSAWLAQSSVNHRK